MDKMRYFPADLDDGTIGDVLAGNIPALCGRPARESIDVFATMMSTAEMASMSTSAVMESMDVTTVEAERELLGEAVRRGRIDPYYWRRR